MHQQTWHPEESRQIPDGCTLLRLKNEATENLSKPITNTGAELMMKSLPSNKAQDKRTSFPSHTSRKAISINSKIVREEWVFPNTYEKTNVTQALKPDKWQEIKRKEGGKEGEKEEGRRLQIPEHR